MWILWNRTVAGGFSKITLQFIKSYSFDIGGQFSQINQFVFPLGQGANRAGHRPSKNIAPHSLSTPLTFVPIEPWTLDPISVCERWLPALVPFLPCVCSPTPTSRRTRLLLTPHFSPAAVGSLNLGNQEKPADVCKKGKKSLETLSYTTPSRTIFDCPTILVRFDSICICSTNLYVTYRNERRRSRERMRGSVLRWSMSCSVRSLAEGRNARMIWLIRVNCPPMPNK
jgi:hypothetical protein